MTKLTTTATLLSAAVATTVIFTGVPAMADHHGSHGAAMAHGSAMMPTRNIVETAANSPVHTTLVAAVKAAGLVETLASPGPFTVFAPTNAAFARLPAGTVETLLRPEQKAALTKVLTYHVVAGNVSSAQLVRMIRAGRGKTELATVAGGKLTARLNGRGIVLIDEMGGRARVTRANLAQSNGVIHVTDAVSLPR